MPTVALRSCTLIGMQLVESMLGSVTKQIHNYMLQVYDSSCNCVVYTLRAMQLDMLGVIMLQLHDTCMQTQQQQQQSINRVPAAA